MGGIEIKQSILTGTIEASQAKRGFVRGLLMRPVVCSVLASFGIFGGISSLFVGIVSVVLHSLVSQDRIFDRVGTWLLIVAIPMILGGSIFLDEVEIKK